MTSKTKKAIIKHDPLAWLKDDGSSPGGQYYQQQSLIAKGVEEDHMTDAPEQDSTKVFCLEARATIAQVETLFKEMHEALRANCHIKLDVSDVEVVDTAVLQLLLIFIKEVKIASDVEWVGVSESFRKAAQLLDLETYLDIA